MAEPQPTTISEGAADPHAPTSTAEDRKAAAALSTLDVADEAGEKKDVDSKALDKAMKGLNVKDQRKVEKAVKIEAADIALVVCRPWFDKLGKATNKCYKNTEADH